MKFFFYLYNDQRIPNKNVVWWFPQLFSTNQHIRMISEGSCDTEDWSNDAENSALITGIKSILNS